MALGDCHEDVIRPTYSLLLTIIYFLRSSFVFWSTRDHSSVVKSTFFEEYLCVVALTGSEQGTQFLPLASYFLV